MVSLITPTSIRCQAEQDIIDDNLISGIVKELKLTEQQPIPNEYNSLFGQIKVKVSKGVKENKWGDYIKNFFKTNKIQDEFIEPVTTLLNEAVLSGENEWNHYEIFEKDKNVDNAHYYKMFISNRSQKLDVLLYYLQFPYNGNYDVFSIKKGKCVDGGAFEYEKTVELKTSSNDKNVENTFKFMNQLLMRSLNNKYNKTPVEPKKKSEENKE